MIMISSNPFRQSSSSPFGSPSVVGQTSNTPFGSPNPFGLQTGSSIFGGTSTGMFGHSTPAFSALSSPAFGSSMPSFGAALAPAFGSSSSFGSVFGQQPAFGGFGSMPSQSSPFGNTFQQTQSAFGSNPFGSTTSRQPAFGASSQPAFGATSTPAFGLSSTHAFGATTTPAFGTASTPAFGATSTPAFGSTSTPAFGSTSTLAFGSTTTPLFGSTGTAFGISTIPASGSTATLAFGILGTSLFGSASTSAFGAASTPAFGSLSTPAFGASSIPSFSFGLTPAFGQSASTFGSTLFGTTLSPFGAQSSPFGAQTTTPTFGSPGFGQTGLGGQQLGSRVVSYSPTPETDAGGTQSAGKLESISAMPAYKDKSHEALRLEDYQCGDEGAQTTTPTFGSPGFGQPGLRVQQLGSRVVPYSPTSETDGGGTQPAGKLESISAMPAYKDKSHEELRWEDYQRGDEGAQTTTPTFGSPGFGQTGLGGQQLGSRVVPYSSTPETDGGGTQPAGKLESISAMPAYKDKSYEALRWEDYQRGDKGAQTTTPTFGSPGFGQTCLGGQQLGSRVVPYSPTPETPAGGTQPAGKLESISAMPAYKDKSHEELRWEDYQRGDKGAQTTTPTFGSPGFGQTCLEGQQLGSRVVPYSPTPETDAGGMQPAGKLESISAMPAYKDKSHEELRWEDYQRGNKGAQTTTPTFGRPGFGQTGLGGQQLGSRVVPYCPTLETDGGGTQPAGKLEPISTMPAYKDKSPEELRWEDYQRGDKGEVLREPSAPVLDETAEEYRDEHPTENGHAKENNNAPPSASPSKTYEKTNGVSHSDHSEEESDLSYIKELAAKDRAEPGFCRRVKDFVVGRRGFGSIRFFVENDARRLGVWRWRYRFLRFMMLFVTFSVGFSVLFLVYSF